MMMKHLHHIAIGHMKCWSLMFILLLTSALTIQGQ